MKKFSERLSEANQRASDYVGGIQWWFWIKLLFFVFIVINIIANGFSGGGENSAYE